MGALHAAKISTWALTLEWTLSIRAAKTSPGGYLGVGTLHSCSKKKHLGLTREWALSIHAAKISTWAHTWEWALAWYTTVNASSWLGTSIALYFDCE